MKYEKSMADMKRIVTMQSVIDVLSEGDSAKANTLWDSLDGWVTWGDAACVLVSRESLKRFWPRYEPGDEDYISIE